MVELFAWHKVHPASPAKPEPTGPDLVVPSMIDISMYAGSPEYERYLAAGHEAGEAAALAAMPLATVSFFEVPKGVDPFDPDAD